MTTEEIISSLEDQVKDRESSIDETDPDCIFRKDAEALREAVKLLRRADKGVEIDPVKEELGGTMRLYDNEGYREEFMELVYALLASDGTNDRANLIIDAFDRAPEVEIDPVKTVKLDRILRRTDTGHWVDNADSYFCSCCRYETNNPNKEPFGPGRCPRCFAQMEKPNVPLTLGELQKLEWDPIWAVDLPSGKGRWEICTSRLYDPEAYGKTWLAYRRRPEEGGRT